MEMTGNVHEINLLHPEYTMEKTRDSNIYSASWSGKRTGNINNDIRTLNKAELRKKGLVVHVDKQEVHARVGNGGEKSSAGVNRMCTNVAVKPMFISYDLNKSTLLFTSNISQGQDIHKEPLTRKKLATLFYFSDHVL
ncbi:hypothetical protein BCR41DRAFT_372989 [Lobosporangium transversale]|uniref:Uncharacterized protein n=1 Tax=Lobosporangium transversale TaxID=64571 RepID=A0A1Y2GGH9_9FUNG|nr:hypothetical protein BCR41DRAFT_372989 [Lobosporangium transversale]ORZ09083.1 hypothetical protein BCR41DRAFT_372989 [Lobosporangium transversale]|eukprot:XP_021878710.1 hypothetical protein BCR41DRAFT_372989 [Lobosporangium transversale]